MEFLKFNKTKFLLTLKHWRCWGLKSTNVQFKTKDKMKNESTELAQTPPFCKTDVRRSFNWLSNFMTTQCPRCELGRVSHNHSEPHGWTTIEVYKCNRCNTEFV